MFNKKTNEALDQLFHRVNELEIGEFDDLVTMTKMSKKIKELERQLDSCVTQNKEDIDDTVNLNQMDIFFNE